jgi:hypothetical protein
VFKIFDRIHVMNGWRLGPHCWWRFLLMPFGWDTGARRILGWTSFSAFGFTFFWMHKLTEEQERMARQNGKKFLRALKEKCDLREVE